MDTKWVDCSYISAYSPIECILDNCILIKILQLRFWIYVLLKIQVILIHISSKYEKIEYKKFINLLVLDRK